MLYFRRFREPAREIYREDGVKKLVEFELAAGGSILVEVEEHEQGGIVPAARPGELVAQASLSFEQALEGIKPAAMTIISKLRSLSEAPDEIEVEFGVKLGAEAGALIAAASAEANYIVKLKWVAKPGA